MSEWGDNIIRNKQSLVLWGSVTVIAIIRYAYDSRCGGRRQVEVPLNPEEAEAQSRNKAAEESLINLLVETLEVFEAPIKAKNGEIAEQEAPVGDIEEGEDSNGDSNEKEVQTFSNGCAICLEEFEEGDRIVHSVTTKGCPHIFHEECLKEVIAASASKGIYSVPCPCCRQTFVETGSSPEVSA
ncbi:unnamed protein product [Cylindrotheca closterium]|uniref:RING-type domain-containing protein n=1 Tax=Cylindrotheca closterium TaxID=2856 RepID=A0AAD2CSN0_9STRA|nr:unnamed protein product [Cylindrotheca closterium]